MATSKTPSNAVRTTNRAYTFYLEKLTFRGSSYYMTKAEMYQAIRYAFEGSNRTDAANPVVYLTANGKTTCAVETNGDTRNNFFSIGCMKFSRNSFVKIALWCGFSKQWVKRYLVG